MKRIFLLSFLLIQLSGTILHAQFSAAQQKAITVKRVIELNHYQPRPVNDTFSLAVFNAVIDAADRRRLLFTASEYKQLQAYSLTLDNELQGKGWGFLDLFSSLHRKALLRADSCIQKLLQEPFDFSVNESITSSREKAYNFSADNTALLSRWTRYLKLMMLQQIYAVVENDGTGKTNFQAALQSTEPAIREKVKQAELRGIKKILESNTGYEQWAGELYLNAIANCFDPHTNYFSPEGKESFQSALSTEGYSFGLDFDENEKHEIVIARLVPGGPAWKSGELHKGDELLQMQWEGKPAVDISGASIEEVYEILEQPGQDKLHFKFKKANGIQKELSLRKAKMDNEENIVKSFVLKGAKKIGYILLPGFYTEWENETGSSCANDVAKEIVKLKKESIDGLVLDVRFNGGGSVEEALEMTGIFINEGPLAAEKNKSGKLLFFKDLNRGTIFDGPMLLLVNGQSASASELLAASLQDYHRAIIVGSNTYGKATMQQLFSLDTVNKNLNTNNNQQDILKITMAKLYRLNGYSAQLNGVTVDIPLPDGFEGMEFGEKFETHALRADSAAKNNYYKPLPALPVTQLAKQSAERLNSSTDFQNIRKIADAQVKAGSVTTITVPLKSDLFEQWLKQQQLDMRIMEGNRSQATKKFAIENHGPDKLLLQDNADAREINQAWMENLAADIYLEEAFSILTDLINLQATTPKN